MGAPSPFSSPRRPHGMGIGRHLQPLRGDGGDNAHRASPLPPHVSTGAHLQQARRRPVSSCTLPGVTCREARGVNRAESFGLCFPPKQTRVTKVTWEREPTPGHRRPPRPHQDRTEQGQKGSDIPSGHPEPRPGTEQRRCPPGLALSRDAAVSPS